ncbi:MAG: phage tail tape measure protein [Bacteroidetes bacterium]|nr:phage tail tape measure protein [Bacteroidota bacterium]
MKVNLRELMYRIYGDDRLSNPLKRISAAGIKADKSLGSLSNKTSKLTTNFKNAASEVPFLNSGLRAMSNPATMAIGLLTGVGAALNTAKNKAVEFNDEFRELVNLNLDKTDGQLNSLRNNVLQTSYYSGFNPLKASQGFYDVQSITGEYGAVVQNVVERAGSFSRVMRSDFNKTVAGSSQAMEIYGLRVNRVDDYLSSLYKTVMVGKTTFDQLSQVQMEYANAAASIGQDYNQANKVFAAFSVVEPSVSRAANMAKTAFEDLTKTSTLKGLKELAGVSVFKLSGEMRGVDSILEDLVPKLKAMSDFEYASLKEKIGGSQGLRGLFDIARNKADKFLETLKTFDNAEYSPLEAYKKALKDVTFLNEELSNRMNSSWIGLGNSLLPIWSNLKIMSIGLLDNTRNAVDNIGDIYNSIYNMPKLLADKAIGYDTMINSRANYSRTKYEAAIGDINSKTPKVDVSALYSQIGEDMVRAYNSSQTKGTAALRETYKNQFNALKELYTQIPYDYINTSKKGNLDNIGNSDDNSINKGLQGISGGGTQMKSVTININKLVESIINNTTTLNEATPEIEEKLTETLVRAIAGAEQIVG